MRLSRRAAFALALVLGLLAVTLAYLYIQGQGEPEEVVQKVQVPVPIEDIPAQIDLRRDMFHQVAFAPDQIPRGAITDPEKIHGTISLDPLVKDTPVLISQVARRSTSLALAYGIPEAYRAITIPVDDVSGVADFIKPGDHVDIIAIFSSQGGEYSTSQTILQDVMVLAVNASTSAPRPKAPAEGEAEGEEGAQPESRRGDAKRTVTIAVTPHEAQIATLSNHQGNLILSLRRTGDRNFAELARTQSWSLIGSFPEKKKDVPDTAKLEAQQPPSWTQMWGGPTAQQQQPQAATVTKPTKRNPAVEVIRGTDRELVEPAGR